MAEELPSEPNFNYGFTDLMKSAIAEDPAPSDANFDGHNLSDPLNIHTHTDASNPANFIGPMLSGPLNIHIHTGASNHAKFIGLNLSVPLNTHAPGASNHAKFIDQNLYVPLNIHTHTGASNHAKFIDQNLYVPLNIHTHTGASNHAKFIDQNLSVPLNIHTHTGASTFDPSKELFQRFQNSWLASNHGIDVCDNMQTNLSCLMGGNGTEGGIQVDNMSMSENTNGIYPSRIESGLERIRQEAMQNHESTMLAVYHGRLPILPELQRDSFMQSNEPQLSLGKQNVYSRTTAASSGMQGVIQMIRNGNPGNQTMRKVRWNKEEDGLLRQLVSLFGLRNWSEIAKRIPGREGKQCRDRWRNELAPNIKKGKWSEQEEKILIDSHKDIGSKWCEIAKRIPGRTENTVKNHWNSTRRRKYPDGKIRKQQKPNTPLMEYIKTLAEPSKLEEQANITNFKDLPHDTNQTFHNFEMPRNESHDVDDYDFLSHVYTNNQAQNCQTEQAATMETSGEDSRSKTNLQDLQVFSNKTILNTVKMPADDIHGLQNMELDEFMYKENLFSPQREPHSPESTTEVGHTLIGAAKGYRRHADFEGLNPLKRG